ncbi:MAG: PEP-utilizing enzyme [bacterium]
MSVFYRKMVKSNDYHADAVRQRTELKRNTIDTASKLERALARMSSTPAGSASHREPSRRQLSEIIESTQLLVDNVNILTKHEFSSLYRALQDIEKKALDLMDKRIVPEDGSAGQQPEEPSEVEWLVTRDGEVRMLNTRTFRMGSPGSGGGDARPASANPVLEGGIAVFPGCSVGPAFVARDCADTAGAPTGAIVVIESPAEEIMNVLPYLAGVISESGDAAGEVAAKARELGLPCIFGMKNATRILRSNQQVFLDAFQRKVFALGAPEDITGPDERPTAKSGGAATPLYDLLFSRNVSATDAELSNPEKCRSIGDIVEFAHAGILKYNEISGRIGKM